MAYNVSNNWEQKVLGEDKKYVSYLTINNTYVPISKISKIEFDEDIVDKENKYMYIGTFRSNQIDITFKSLEGLDIASNMPVHCEIGLNTDYQAINFTYIGLDNNGNKQFEINNAEDLQYFKTHYYVNISVNNVKYERIEILDIANNVFTLDAYQISEIQTSDTIVIYPFEYVPKGEYLIDELDKNYQKTCKITCLDYGIKLKPSVDYSSAFVDGKITLKNLLIWLCNHYNVQLGTYPNVNNNIEISVYDGTLSGKTYVSYIAEMFGGNIKFDRNGILNIIPLKQNAVKTINALKTKSFNLGEKFKISKVVYQDAIRIFDVGNNTENTLYIRPENMFVPDEQSIENIYNAVKNFEMYSLTNEIPADLSLDSWDIVNYQVNNNIYPTYYNNKTTYTGSMMSKVETKIPTKQQEQTTNVVNANVDAKLSIVKTTIDLLNASIELLAKKVIEVSNNVKGTGSIQLSNAYSGALYHLEITGNISMIFPQNDLYPNDNLYPLDSYLLVDNTKYHLDFTILRFINSQVCDKYIYENGKQWIERHVGVDNQGNLYELETPIIENKQDLIIEVNSNSVIHLESFNNANYNCTYLLDNEYTKNFANNVEVQSQILQTANSILSTVSATYETKGEARTQYSQIKQTTDSINLEVASKVDNEDYTGANIMLKVNNDTSESQINADKISLNGKTIDMTSDNIAIDSTNFKVDKDGNCTANSFNSNNATITGGSMNISNSSGASMITLTDNRNNTQTTMKGSAISLKKGNDKTEITEGDIILNYSNGSEAQLSPAGVTVGTSSNFGYYLPAQWRIKSSSGETRCDAGGTPFVVSDKRFKENINYIDKQKSFKIINELKPIEYNLKNNQRIHRGLIAQEVVDTLNKNNVKNQIYEIDEKGYYSLCYTELIPDLINCIKYQQEQIETLQNKIEKLEREEK